jgi:hypothetical protein
MMIEEIYRIRERDRSNIFDYIEMCYHPKQRHGANGGKAQVEHERFRHSGAQVSQKPWSIHFLQLTFTRRAGFYGARLPPTSGAPA